MKARVLVSAYACEPDAGSEPGIGWNVALELARRHEVWVLTRANNEPAIARALASLPPPHPRFIYFDLPRWARFWKRGGRGVQLYYYLWQLMAFPLVKRTHRRVRFDLVHHVTFGRYWSPSLLWTTGVPFVWGPVGGGESSPPGFSKGFSLRGKVYERSRDVVRAIGEADPLVRRTARSSTLCLATTSETASRVVRLGAPNVVLFPQVALPEQEIVRLAATRRPENGVVRFVSIGRLLHWKGIHLAIQALATASLDAVEYRIVGDGPERARLERLADSLGVGRAVFFEGAVARDDVLRMLGECHALLHPSLHDSGGWAVLEAMAAGLPVICLEAGAPPTLVGDRGGITVPAGSPAAAVEGMAEALRALAADTTLRTELGEAAGEHVAKELSWPHHVSRLDELLLAVLRREELPDA